MTDISRVVVGVVRIVFTGLSWIVRVLATILLFIAVTGLFLALIFAVYVKFDLSPHIDLDLTTVDMAENSQIYYIDKYSGDAIPLQTIYAAENSVWVTYDQLPQNLIDAAIAIEDQRFERHQGVDWYRTGGAFIQSFLGGGDMYGGSTITQQLIKNITEDDEVTVSRKLTEIFRALEFEQHYTKKTIMEWYLNNIYFGERCKGAETASLEYFGKDVWDLSLAECASLIGITNNPSLYDPYISEDTRENNKERQELVLDQMYKQGKISKQEMDAALAQTLVFQEAEVEEQEDEVYSWFIDQVIYDVTADLAKKYSITEESARLLLSTGGYKIYSTIDPHIQAIAEGVYEDLSNLPGYYSRYNQQLQSAITIIEPHTGDIVAIIGGVGQKTESMIWSRASMTVRSPGSSIKPITVYGPAIEEGLITPASVYDDAPVKFGEEYGGAYPKNQNNSYRGLTTITYAVQASLNTVAVRVVDEMGPEVSFDYAVNHFGITSLVDRRETSDGRVLTDIGLGSMALGGLTDGVSTRELTAAYATYANDGLFNPARTYTQMVDREGKVILDNTGRTTEAVSQRTVYYMNQLLTNVVTNGTGVQAQLDNMTVAGKTGTTSDDNDRWFVGYTPYYAAAVWVGYDTPEEISIDSYTNPALWMWRLVMEKVHENLPYAEFETNVETVTEAVCLDSGKLVSSACQSDRRGSRGTYATFVVGDEPKEYCHLHVFQSICKDSGSPPNEYCPEESVGYVGMLDYLRQFPMPGIYVGDQSYMVGQLYHSLDPGMYLASGSMAYSCTVHDENTPKPEDEKDPDEKDPDEKDPDEKDPDEKDPDGKDPDIVGPPPDQPSPSGHLNPLPEPTSTSSPEPSPPEPTPSDDIPTDPSEEETDWTIEYE